MHLESMIKGAQTLQQMNAGCILNSVLLGPYLRHFIIQERGQTFLKDMIDHSFRGKALFIH